MANELKVSAHQIVVSDCPIAKLADEDLVAIFKHLPPFERLIVSEVCSKWRDLSKTPWRDVTHLDLSQVPTQNIHAVIRKCPNIFSVSAGRQNLGDLGRFASRLHNVTSWKCVDCAFSVPRMPYDWSTCLRNAPLSELIWHTFKLNRQHRDQPVSRLTWPLWLPDALRRLQLSAWDVRSFLHLRWNLPQLESFAVSFQNPSSGRHASSGYLWNIDIMHLRASKNLRELYLDSSPPFVLQYEELAFSLPRLQILFLNNCDFRPAPLRRLLLRHPSLRVVVLTASFIPKFVGEHVIPTRKLYPGGFNAEPVPQLHLFLGKTAAEKLRFQPSPANALKIYPIDAPLPEYLEKEEIKPIFERSWIASRIKEGAKEGVNLTDYSFESNTESIDYVEALFTYFSHHIFVIPESVPDRLRFILNFVRAAVFLSSLSTFRQAYEHLKLPDERLLNLIH